MVTFVLLWVSYSSDGNFLNQPFQHTRNMYETDTYEFCFNSGNKIARVEIGQEGELTLSDVLRAVQDILVAGGYTYIDEIRAVNYGEGNNKYRPTTHQSLLSLL